jgi:hypothetical protein
MPDDYSMRAGFMPALFMSGKSRMNEKNAKRTEPLCGAQTYARSLRKNAGKS